MGRSQQEMQPNALTHPQSKLAVFFQRLGSFIFLWAVILTAMFSGHKMLSDYVFLVIVTALAAAGLIEFYAMARKMSLYCFDKIGILAGVLLIAGTFFFISGQADSRILPVQINDFESCFAGVFVLGLCARQFLSKTSTNGIVAIGTTLLGFVYVALLLNYLQKIYFFGQGFEGRFYLLYFILITKFSDAGAYMVGSLIGKHKMIPRVSPGKTWEGFAGAIVVSTGLSLLFAHCAGGHLPGMTPLHALVLGLILSAAAVVGDLIESIFKRQAGIKDSGHFFPGIGGILDLLDSLLFNAPIMYVYLRHVLTRP